ncbi:MAG: NfeD family protein [Proteobacteria bacterium]|nr:NfeD family protein [Pseudomonadota bacterium]
MLWWYWIILGAVLLVSDIALINIYYLLWFGLGALIVGLLMLAVPTLPLALQITLFGVISTGFLLLWLWVLRPHGEKKLLAGAKEELIGSNAAVVRFANGSGTLRLQKPIGGRDVWRFTSKDNLRAGATVQIFALDENSRVVQATATPTTSPTEKTNNGE